MAARTVHVDFVVADGADAAVDYKELQQIADSIRQCAKFVDTPTSELYTDSYIEEIKAIAAKLPSVKVTIIRGEELKQRGFGGLWGVGKVSTFSLFI